MMRMVRYEYFSGIYFQSKARHRGFLEEKSKIFSTLIHSRTYLQYLIWNIWNDK